MCNGTLSFYTLPELSPAFNNTTVANCTWVGGVDLNGGHGDEEHGVIVMICVKTKTRLVRLRDEARRVKDIEYPGCLTSIRRGGFACVADSHSYALIDLENQQKISLFPISSLDENASSGKIEDVSTPEVTPSRKTSSFRPTSSEGLDIRAHGRSTSLGTLVSGLGIRPESPHSRSRDRSGLNTPEPTLQDSSPAQSGHSRAESVPGEKIASSSNDKPLSPPPPRSSSLRPPQSGTSLTLTPLLPRMCSPSSTEFLLLTGTTSQEAGVGMFVNLDGDVVRGTMEFTRYPTAVVLTGAGTDIEREPLQELSGQEGFVLALIPALDDSKQSPFLEIQRWDVEDGREKETLTIPKTSSSKAKDSAQDAPTRDAGLRSVKSGVSLCLREVGELLRGRRLRLPGGHNDKSNKTEKEAWEVSREQEEVEFGLRLGQAQSNVAFWSGSCIWVATRNPLASRLDAIVEESLKLTSTPPYFDRIKLYHTVNSIRGQEPTSEADFLGIGYIRQKISLLLFSDLLIISQTLDYQSKDLKATENLLIEGALDPRVVLNLLPPLQEEVIEGARGIWIHAGLISVVESVIPMIRSAFKNGLSSDVLILIKQYLMAWRQRKGFGSIADEKEVFQTVDAALLRVLIQQEGLTANPTAERVELYNLVDSGLDCFDRAVVILEQHHHLYILSRLYQSKRMARRVLETWRRIIEGERDVGGEFTDGENEVRKYLINIKETALVDEYGTWLAARNPSIGVQVFTNENSRVKWEPHQVVMLLRRRAPDSVKDYLEHLVFGKKHFQYANDLIFYYLDSVLAILSSSDDAHNILSQSYETYRALRPPKPTYRQFITENAAPYPWWHDRLRLLELIGGSHGSDFSYDVGQILSRIESFEEDLVPESIILDGRQGRHKEALRLLTHGLGDYHTAVNYCLLGGASIFHPSHGSSEQTEVPSQEEQSRLFGYLLTEFLRIEDASDRLERTSELLERFSSWYDVREVLDLIPGSWSVELVSGFLVSAFRHLVHEKNEAVMVKALSGAENLQVASNFVEKCTALGPRLQTAEGPD